jgi:hypothetical protein
MSFGAEMKDFISAMGAVNTMAGNAAHARYYNARANAFKNSIPNTDTSKAAVSPSAGVVPAVSASVSSDEDQDKSALDYTRYLVSKGEKPGVAGSIVGNGWHESGFKPTVEGDKDSPKGSSYGIFQFNKSGRLPVAQKWAADNNRDLSDPYAQHDFVLYDLKTNFPDLYKKMNEAPDAGTSTELFMNGYENPKKETANLPSRLSRTSRALDLYNQAGGMGIPVNSPMYAHGGYVQTLANGPMVEPVEGDPESEIASEDYQDGSDGSESAIPTQPMRPVPANSKSPATLGEAIDSGLHFLTSAFGLDKNSTAIGPDNKLAEGQQRLLSGEGADHEGFEQAKLAVDKNNEMTDAQRSLYATVKGYEFFRDRGDPTKAARYAAMAIQSAGDYASKYGALAVHAAQQGDTKGMIKYAEKAYDYTLDGKIAKATELPDGQIKVDQNDINTGKTLKTYTISPAQLINSVMGLTNKSGYYDQLMRMAAQEPSVAARRLAMQQEQENKIAGLRETLAHMDDGVTPQGNGDTALPVGKTNTNQSVAQPPVAQPPASQPPVAQPPASNTSAIPADLNDLPVGGYTPIPKVADETGINPEVTEPKAIPTDGAGGDYSKIPVPVKGVPKPFPEPRPVMSPQKIEALRDLVTQGPKGRDLAKGEEARFKTEVLQPFLDRQKAWDADQKASINSDYLAKVSTYNELIKNAGVANSNKSTDKRQKFIEDQTNNRTKVQTDAAALLEKNRQDNAIQLEQLKAARPIPFFAPASDNMADDTNKARTQSVEKIVTDTLAKSIPVDPEDNKPLFDIPANHVQGLRDAVIAAYRYNGGMPLDTATKAIITMTQPNDDKSARFKVEPIKGIPDDPTDGPRVKVTFKNPNSIITGIILPASTIERIDTMRGEQLKLHEDAIKKIKTKGLDIAAENAKLEDLRNKNSDKYHLNRKLSRSSKPYPLAGSDDPNSALSIPDWAKPGYVPRGNVATPVQ